MCPPPQLGKVDRSLDLDQEFGLKWVDLEEFYSLERLFQGTLMEF